MTSPPPRQEDYSFMRSGQLDGDELPAGVQSTVKRLVSVAIVIVARSGDTAATYAQHAGRTQVTREDVQRALKYQTRVIMRDDGLEEDTHHWEQQLTAEMERESESESESDDVVAEPPEVPDQPWTKSECTCQLCVAVNDSHDTWDTWQPDDEVEQYLKKYTDKAIAEVD